MKYPVWDSQVAESILAPLASDPGPVLISLQALQEHFGYVHPDALPLIASTFNVSRADVHGVLTFYHELRTSPAPAHQVHLCAAEACQSMGARELQSKVEGNVSAEVSKVYCLGNCALAPAALVDGKLMGRATLAKIQEELK